MSPNSIIITSINFTQAQDKQRPRITHYVTCNSRWTSSSFMMNQRFFWHPKCAIISEDFCHPLSLLVMSSKTTSNKINIRFQPTRTSGNHLAINTQAIILTKHHFIQKSWAPLLRWHPLKIINKPIHFTHFFILITWQNSHIISFHHDRPRHPSIRIDTLHLSPISLV